MYSVSSLPKGVVGNVTCNLWINVCAMLIMWLSTAEVWSNYYKIKYGHEIACISFEIFVDNGYDCTASLL